MTGGMETIARLLVIAGIGLALVGGVIFLLAKAFPNLSQLPGTIHIQGAGMTCVFPLLASIILSIVLTIVLNIFARLIK